MNENKFLLSQEAAKLIAVGLYRQIDTFIRAADPAALEKFRVQYEKKKTVQASKAKEGGRKE
ncbi:MAG: hypothetical protein FWD48_11080 [Oscillospiraceae bacterium]|nr:hypothetical protein [Oscillospiraceae bacterium]